MKLTSYSRIRDLACSWIGLANSSMTSTEQDWVKQYVRSNIKTLWEKYNWQDLTPFGEARFVGDLFTSPNDYTNSAWTQTNVSVTAESIQNPADGRVTANKLLETSATGAHGISQIITFLPGADYMVSIYARPNGRGYLYVSATDGVNTWTAFYNLSNGVVGTTTGTFGTAPTMAQQNNGFYICYFSFTASSTAGSGSVTYDISTDGSTTSYTGNTSLGLYLWGALCQQLTLVSPEADVILWDQEGEAEIDAIFQVWRDNPFNTAYPRPQNYSIVPAGIQIITTAGWGYGVYGYGVNVNNPITNPVFLLYRKACPDFYGPDYSASSTYAVDDQVLYTNSSNVANYYKCIVATSAGQNPTNTPSSWELLEIPDVFYHATARYSYADWLRQDGQTSKAEIETARGDEELDNEFDRQDRQMGNVLPMRVLTHQSQMNTY